MAGGDVVDMEGTRGGFSAKPIPAKAGRALTVRLTGLGRVWGPAALGPTGEGA